MLRKKPMKGLIRAIMHAREESQLQIYIPFVLDGFVIIPFELSVVDDFRVGFFHFLVLQFKSYETSVLSLKTHIYYIVRLCILKELDSIFLV